MKKVFLSLLVACGLSTASFGQFKLGVTPGVTFGGISTGFGLGLQPKYGLGEKASVGLNIGYYTLGSESKPLYGSTIEIEQKSSVIPVLANFEYSFLTEGFKPFVGLNAGIYLLSYSTTVGGNSYNANKSYFGIAPVAGFDYDLSKSVALRASFTFNAYFSSKGSTTSSTSTSTTTTTALTAESYETVNIGVIFAFGGK